ncbi:MAG: DUF4350 domain-containing protein [Microbacteriaceae bacterium]
MAINSPPLAAATPSAPDVITPTVGRSLRRSLFWIGATILAFAIAIVGVLLGGQSGPRDFLDGESAAPDGARAVLEVLRGQGVAVTTTDSIEETVAAVGTSRDTTLVLFDRDYILDDDKRDILFGLSDTVVLIEPSFDDLGVFAPGVAQAGVVDADLTADCSFDAVQRAGSVSSNGVGYRIIDNTPGTVACLGSADDTYSLVRIESDTQTVTVVGTSTALSNGIITEKGNAALAVNLLGENDNLVWYIPGLPDLAGDYPPTLGELSPPWVIAVTSLLAFTALAAAVWRGRRFGPLVIENLPVTVRSSETMQGRARLYERSSARLHALDALRIGTISRLAAQCGLSNVASVDDVVASVSSITGANSLAIRTTLVDAVPHSDSELVSLSDDLLEIEATVTSALRPQ